VLELMPENAEGKDFFGHTSVLSFASQDTNVVVYGVAGGLYRRLPGNYA
jgi:hypothetical protein